MKSRTPNADRMIDSIIRRSRTDTDFNRALYVAGRKNWKAIKPYVDRLRQQAKEDVEFTDRYKALGMPYPDPDTMCLGQCEGVGLYPENDTSSKLWQEAERLDPSEDGWHFVTCPDCNGTGKAK